MIETFWKEYQKQVNDPTLKYKSAYSFGVEADKLANLVLNGEKQATSSLLYSYQRESEPIPQSGEYYIILDSKEEPVAVIQNQQVKIFSFKDVSHQIAKLEGEGNLKKWKADHQAFFTNELKGYELPFNQNQKIVVEIFELKYSKQ